MRAGLIRRRVTVQRYTATQNSLGEEVESWSNLFSAVSYTHLTLPTSDLV